MTRIAAFLLLAIAPLRAADWNGYQKTEFMVEGRQCYVVAPRIAAPGKPWYWQAKFPDYHPEPAIGLLEKGFHVAFINLPNDMGSPKMVAEMDRFYDHVVKTFGLSEKVSLEGVSRGGLFVYNWTLKNIAKVNAIYCDSPVLDIKSWPGGKGKGKGSANDWKQALAAYGFTEQQMLEFRGNPVDTLGPIAKAGIPALHIVSDRDEIVPPSENTDVFAARYRQLGGPITVYRNQRLPDGLNGHHYSLDDWNMPANFILRHTPGMADRAGKQREFFELRGGLPNALKKFEQGGEARVVFLGGSITAMNGWRDLTCAHLGKLFPKTKFDCVNAGISSTGSTPGAFRLMRDVFGRGPVDLLFEEAAVNDDTNAFEGRDAIRGMEGIVRHAKTVNPNIDIVLMHFVDPGKMKTILEGRTPAVIEAHERVARHYNVPSIDLAREVTARIDAGEFTWDKDFVSLHPSPFGQTVYFRSIARLLDAAMRTSFPPPIDANSYYNGRLVDIREVTPGDGWRIVEDWAPQDKAGTRKGFVHVPMLVGDKPGAECRFTFDGTAVGIFVAAGPDAGVVEYSIDNSLYKDKNLMTQWSPTLHIPWAYILEADLAPGRHELVLRVKSGAVRIVHMLAN